MEIMMIENAPLTMSSKEIAELTGKEHKHVLRDIRNMLESLYGEKAKALFEDKKHSTKLWNEQNQGVTDGPKLDHELNQGVSIIRDSRGYVSMAIEPIGKPLNEVYAEFCYFFASLV